MVEVSYRTVGESPMKQHFNKKSSVQHHADSRAAKIYLKGPIHIQYDHEKPKKSIKIDNSRKSMDTHKLQLAQQFSGSNLHTLEPGLLKRPIWDNRISIVRIQPKKK